MIRDDQQVQDAGIQHNLSSLVCLHDGVRDKGGRDRSSTKPASVQALDRRLRSLDGIELDVDLALYHIHFQYHQSFIILYTDLGFPLDFDELDMAIFFLAFALDVVRQVLVPIALRFSVERRGNQ